MIEWEHAFILFFLGLIIYKNPNFFDKANYPAFFDMFDSAKAWMLLFLFIGVGRLIILMINGSWRRTPHFRAFFAFLSAGVFSLVSLNFYRPDNLSTAMAVYPSFVVFEIVIFFLTIDYASEADKAAAYAKSHG